MNKENTPCGKSFNKIKFVRKEAIVMKFLPGFSLLDNTIDNFFDEPFELRKQNFMKTDIHEKDGYLIVNATTNTNKEEKDENGNIIKKRKVQWKLHSKFENVELHLVIQYIEDTKIEEKRILIQ